jgi:hypothetical protein
MKSVLIWVRPAALLCGVMVASWFATGSAVADSTDERRYSTSDPQSANHVRPADTTTSRPLQAQRTEWTPSRNKVSTLDTPPVVRRESRSSSRPLHSQPDERGAVRVARGESRNSSEFERRAFSSQWNEPARKRPARRVGHYRVVYQEDGAPIEPVPQAQPEEIPSPHNHSPHNHSPHNHGEMIYEEGGSYEGGHFEEGGEIYEEGEFLEGGYEDGYVDGCPDCGAPGMGPHPHRPCYVCQWYWWENFSMSVGVQSFQGPVDQGRNGNFGFNESFNWGGPMWYAANIGYQIGARFVQANFSGDQVMLPSNSSREQAFVTAGLFRRAQYWGPWGLALQYGAVYDYMNDNYYVSMNLGQVRAEISLVTPTYHELGFWAAAGTKDDSRFEETTGMYENWRPQDMYTLFYRRTFCNGSQGRLWGGATSDGDGIFGGEFQAPLGDTFAIQTDFNLLEPHETDTDAQEQQGWAVGINLVWYPGHTAICSMKSRWRPLFNVGDNATFIAERDDPTPP